MPYLPEQFDGAPVYDLLVEAETGLIGFDRRLIRSLLARREETVAALARFASEERKEALLDLDEQVFDLFRVLRAPEALPFYARLLERAGGTVPDTLVEALADLGEAAVDPLLALYAKSSPDDQPDVAFVLATLGTHDDRIRALIEQTLARDPYEGALAAGLYHDPALAPAVQRALESLSPDQETERNALEECLAALEQPRGPHEPEPVEIDSLYPETALPLFDSIAPEEALGFFSSPVEDYRRRAALSFTDDDYEDGVRDALLALSRDDASPAVRGAALRALGERLEEPPVRALLVEALSSRREHAEEWLGALVGLATAGSEPAVTRAIEAAYDRPGCRAGALEAMWRSLDPGWEPYFGPNLRGEDVEVRRQAIQGAGALGITELAIDLLPFLDDEDCREDALFSYALAVSGKTSPRFVRRLLEDIDEKAGGLSAAEEELVSLALDRRLERDGLAPVFFPPHEHEDHHHHDAPPEAEQRASVKAGRNDPCPCGSGKKYKKCCGA